MGTQHLDSAERKERAKQAARIRWDQHTPISQRAADRIARIAKDHTFTEAQLTQIHAALKATQGAQA